MYTSPNDTSGNVTEYCPYLCDFYENINVEVLLDQAPCPPVWKTSLFWRHPKLSSLSNYEVGYIVRRCKIPPEADLKDNTLLTVVLPVVLSLLVLAALVVFLVYIVHRYKCKRRKVEGDYSSDSSIAELNEDHSSTREFSIRQNIPVRYNGHDNVAFDKPTDEINGNTHTDLHNDKFLDDNSNSETEMNRRTGTDENHDIPHG